MTSAASIALAESIAAELAHALSLKSARRPFHRRAVEKAIVCSGHPLSAINHKKSRIDPLVLEKITTGVMSAWVKMPSRGSESRRRLLRPLIGVARACGRCEGKPLGLWMLDKAGSNNVEERKAIAAAVGLMFNAPLMRDELAHILSTQLADQNKQVRALAACVVARAGARLTDTTIASALLACLRDCIDNALKPARLPLRPARTADEIEVYSEDLRGNHLDAYAWTSAAAATGSLGLTADAVIAELRKGLGGPHWLMRAIAAQAMTRAGQARIEVEAAFRLLQSFDRRQEALRRLFALAGETRLSDSKIHELREALICDDMAIAAAAMWPAAVVCRSRCKASAQIQADLERLTGGPVWPLNAIAQSSLLLTRPFGACNVIESFQDYVIGATESTRRFKHTERMNPEISEDSPIIGCLAVQIEARDSSQPGYEARKQRMDATEAEIRKTPIFAEMTGEVFIQRQSATITALCFGGIRANLEAAEQISRSLVVHPMRFAIHAGTGVLVRQQLSGDWVVEGDLIQATMALASRAGLRQMIVSDRIAAPLCADQSITRRLKPIGSVTVPGAIEMPTYVLEARAPTVSPKKVAEARRRKMWIRSLVEFVGRALKETVIIGFIAAVVCCGVIFGPSIKALVGDWVKTLSHVSGPIPAPVPSPPTPTPPVVDNRSNESKTRLEEENRDRNIAIVEGTHPDITVNVIVNEVRADLFELKKQHQRRRGKPGPNRISINVSITEHGGEVQRVEVWDAFHVHDNLKSVSETHKFYDVEVSGEWAGILILYHDPTSDRLYPVRLEVRMPKQPSPVQPPTNENDADSKT